YMFLLEKREENSLSMTMTVAMARLIEKPYCNGIPVAPRGMVIMLASFLLGLIVPVAVIFVKELFNVTVTDRHDVESHTSLPIVGELCHENLQGRAIVVKADSTSVSNEHFRAVRNNIQFITGTGDKKVITFTSSIPGEGKTFASTNVAATFAMTNRKVIVIGLDLRNPQLAKVFGLENKGITNYLSGQVSGWKELVVKSKEFPSLDILPAGPVPLNPNEMLMSGKLKSMIQELKEQYDYVLIDSAPVGVVSDTFLLKDMTDLFLFVCRANYTNKKLIDHVSTLVNEGKLHHVYFVINDVDIQSKAYRYGKYGYGYGKYAANGYAYLNKNEPLNQKAN
ncbi:MAG: polysaccharide biosynthesis tyrosine autokinase, partial [Bacteroidales bacterium]